MPRKSRTRKSESPDQTTSLDTALAEVAERHHIVPASELPEPPLEPLSHAERARPDGPRHRRPGEPATVFAGPDFKLQQTPERRIFRYDHEPEREQKDAMMDAGLSYSPNEKAWSAPNTPVVREASDRLALAFSGKGEALGYGR